jgi:putative ABC transport system permease protein
VVACATVAVVSNAVARNEALAADLSSEAALSITVTATDSDVIPLPRALVFSIASLPGVVQAVGLTAPKAAVNALLPASSNTVGVFGVLELRGEGPLTVTSGRDAGATEVLLSGEASARLGISRPAIGSVQIDGVIAPTVGSFEPSGSGRLAELLVGAAVTPINPDSAVGILSIRVNTAADVAAVASAIRQILAPLGPSTYVVDLDQRAAEVDELVRATTRSSTRSLAIGLLGSGGIAGGLISLLNALSRRRDFARQRALGSTRLDLMRVAVIQSFIVALLGASVGSAIGVAFLTKGVVDRALPISVTITVVTIQTLAVVPGAAFGALQDPAKILRVP